MSTQPNSLPPSPQTTALLLLGASHWPDAPAFTDNEGFAHGARKIKDYFLQIDGIPSDHIRSYFDDPRSGTDMTTDIYAWLGRIKSEVRDLIIYYIGHAKMATNITRQFYLAIRNTQEYDPAETSLRVSGLVNAIKAYRSLRQYYIFDCCFAATAIPYLQGASEQDLLERTFEEIQLEKRGVTALFSSGGTDTSVILPDQQNTFFSEAFLTALQNISSISKAPLSFIKVYPEINQQLEALYQRYRYHQNVQKPPRAVLYSGNLSNIPIFFQHKQAPSNSSPQAPRLEPKDIRQITQLVGQEHGVTALALSPDNETLVSGDERGKVKIWDIAHKTSIALKKVPILGINFTEIPWGLNSVTSIIFHPEGKTFYVGWRDGKSKLWSSSGDFITSWLDFHSGGITALAISPDGLVLISAGGARRHSYGHGHSRGGSGEISALSSLKKWKYPKTDKQINDDEYKYVDMFDYYDTSEATFSIAFSPRGHFFAASDSTGKIRIWDIYRREELMPLKNKVGFQEIFEGIVFHPEENLIAATNKIPWSLREKFTTRKEGQCLIWNVSTGNIQNILDPLSGKITAIAFSPDGYYLTAAHSSGVIGFWDPFSGKRLHSFQAHNQSITALVYSSDGYNLISGSPDKTIKVWGN